MDAVDMIRGRRSIRQYTDEVVDREIMDQIIENCTYSPSWANTQIARYTVIDNKEMVDKLAEECMFGPNVQRVKNAPSVVVLSYVTGKSGCKPGGGDGGFVTSKGDRWEMFDAGIACQTFCLAAYEKGIGTVIMGLFDEKKTAEFISLPEGETVAAVIPYGYSAKEPSEIPKNSVMDVVRYL